MPDERYLPDVDNLQTIEDVIAWLRVAAGECMESAKSTSHDPSRKYLRGRAHAFGLAARLVEDVTRRCEE